MSAKYNRRVSRSTASVKTPTKKIMSPLPKQTTSKRERKIHIDYKQLHEEGIFEEKKQKTEKYAPMFSGPSETRIAAQNQILQRKKSPHADMPRNKKSDMNQDSAYLPRRSINVTQRTVKQEHYSYQPTRHIKPEPGIFMRHREHPNDRDRQWKYVHVSGRKCRQGGSQDCNSQSKNEIEEETLPDLASTTTYTSSIAKANTIPNISISGNTELQLTSPPAVV